MTQGTAVTRLYYDGNGMLVKKKAPDNTTTYTIGGIYEVQGMKMTSYYYLDACH